MSKQVIENIAKRIVELDKKIVLVYAFNGTGKTRLSVAFKDVTKSKNKGTHSGVYYNAYSEDLFVWDNGMHPTNGILFQQGFVDKLRQQIFELRGFGIVDIIDHVC